VNRKKILVIEDDEDTLLILQGIMETMGYNVSLASHGLKGIEMANQLLPDLILLDIMLPTMSGWEVCRRLKRDPKTRKIPIIFLTALDQTEDRVLGISLSAHSYITKPFHREELKKAIDEVFSREKSRE